MAQRNLTQIRKSAGRSKDPVQARASLEQEARRLGHQVVWDGKFCHCGNPGCTCNGWSNSHKGLNDGNILRTQCIAHRPAESSVESSSRSPVYSY